MNWERFNTNRYNQENWVEDINKIDLKRTKLTKEDITSGKCYMYNIMCGYSNHSMSRYYKDQLRATKYLEWGDEVAKNYWNGYYLCDLQNKDYEKEDYYKYFYEFMYQEDVDPNHYFRTPNSIFIRNYPSYSWSKNCRAWSPFSIKRILNLKFTKFITEKHKLDINTFKKLWKLFINHFKKSKHEFSYSAYCGNRNWERKKKLNWWELLTDGANFYTYMELRNNNNGIIGFTYYMKKKRSECAVDSEEILINYPELNYDNNKDLLNDLHILFTYAFISHKSVVEEHKGLDRLEGCYSSRYSDAMKKLRIKEFLKNLQNKCKWKGEKLIRCWDNKPLKKEGGLTPYTDWIV